MAPADDESNLCVFNGINGATGKYLTPPMEPERLIQSAMGAAIDPKRPADPEARWLGSFRAGMLSETPQ